MAMALIPGPPTPMTCRRSGLDRSSGGAGGAGTTAVTVPARLRAPRRRDLALAAGSRRGSGAEAEPEPPTAIDLAVPVDRLQLDAAAGGRIELAAQPLVVQRRSPGLAGDVEEEAGSGHRDEQRGSTRGEERQGQAGHRHQPGHTA